MHLEFSTIQELVEYALQAGFQEKGMHCFGRVAQELADSIAQAIAKDLRHYRITIDNSAIRHIVEQHGSAIEIKRGQLPVTETDFISLQHNILTPTQVHDGGQKEGQLASIKFVLLSGLVETVVVLTIHPGKRRQYLAVKTIYKRKGQPQ